MRTFNQQNLLHALENQVERHLKEGISQFQNLAAETLLQPAGDGGWSIAQCLDHLNGYGKFYLPAIGKGLETPGRATGKFTSTWLGNYFTRMMDPATGKRKFKAFKAHTPPRQLDAHAVVAEFIQQQEILAKYLEQAKNSNLDKVRIPMSISRLVRLKLGDVFRFLVAHNERHVEQAKRTIASTLNIKKAPA